MNKTEMRPTPPSLATVVVPRPDIDAYRPGTALHARARVQSGAPGIWAFGNGDSHGEGVSSPRPMHLLGELMDETHMTQQAVVLVDPSSFPWWDPPPAPGGHGL